MAARWEDTPARRPARPVGLADPDDIVRWANDAELGAEYRAACLMLASIHKSIPLLPAPDDDQGGPWDIDWKALDEASGPWSSGERIIVQLADSIARGALNDAAWRLDDGRWHRLLDALDVLRGGR